MRQEAISPPRKESSSLFLFQATSSFFQGEIPFNKLKEQSHNPNRTHKTIPSSVSIHSLKEQIFCNVKIIKCTNCRSRDKTLRDQKYQGCETNSQSSAFIFNKTFQSLL